MWQKKFGRTWDAPGSATRDDSRASERSLGRGCTQARRQQAASSTPVASRAKPSAQHGAADGQTRLVSTARRRHGGGLDVRVQPPKQTFARVLIEGHEKIFRCDRSVETSNVVAARRSPALEAASELESHPRCGPGRVGRTTPPRRRLFRIGRARTGPSVARVAPRPPDHAPCRRAALRRSRDPGTTTTRDGCGVTKRRPPSAVVTVMAIAGEGRGTIRNRQTPTIVIACQSRDDVVRNVECDCRSTRDP